MTVDLAFHAPRAVIGGAERACTVGVRDGRIVAVEPLGTELDAAGVVSLAGDEVLLPGLVDTHVHVNEPGRTEWEGFRTATQAAAAGGITTLIDMPLNSIPPTTTVDALRCKQESARDRVHVDVGFWGGAVPGNLADIAPLHDAGVFGFKCFLIDSGVEEFAPLDAEEFLAAMTETARLGARLIVHAEDPATVQQAPAGPGYGGFLGSRPPAAEDRAIAHVIAAARKTGGRAHVLHLSSAEALDELGAARAEGLAVTVETCPHYLALDAEHIPDGATEFKCCPPIRDRGNQDRLWDALAGGVIDVVVSDHSPSTPELKQTDATGDRRSVGDFGSAWGGIASVQLSLPVMWTAAEARGHSLADVVGWMAQGPADLVGLRHKGRIAVGADADLCVLAPDTEFVVDPRQLRHKHPITAYAGSRLRGEVRRTWLRGTPVDPESEPHGRLLARGMQ